MITERQRRRLAQYFAAGLTDAALPIIEDWLELEPSAFEPNFFRIQIRLQQGRPRLAYDDALSLMQTRECPIELFSEAASCLNVFAAHDALIDLASKFNGRDSLPARDRSNVAVTLSGIGAHHLALVWAESAVDAAPTDAVCLVNRALILGYLGQMARASLDLEYVIRESRHTAMAHWLVSRMRKQTIASNHVQRIRKALTQTNLHSTDQSFLAYALFKELDDLGDYEGAWQALENAAKSMQAHSTYDSFGQEKLFDAIKRTFPLVTQLPHAESTTPQSPIFIVGLHRSGTSLIERILGASADVCDLGETQRLQAAIHYATNSSFLEPIDAAFFNRIADIDLVALERVFSTSAARQSDQRQFVTEKLPSNFLHIGFIRHAIPQAKIIHMRRDPMDLCFANYRERFGAAITHTHSLENIAHYHRLYDQLMTYWQQIYPGFVLEVRYESLVQDPIKESQRVFNFCNIEWKAEHVDLTKRVDAPVSTLSAVQVRNPVNVASVGRWKNYEKWLEPLKQALL
jgi:tetratricopeptide (TPR) repeat protein